MKKILTILVAALAAAILIVAGYAPGSARTVSPQEFYYFDENGLRTPLKFSRSIAVKFLVYKNEEDRRKYLQEKYSPANIRTIANVYSRAEFALEFSPYMEEHERIAILARMANDSDIDAAPIFLVDGMEAAVDGFYLETATPLSADTIRTAIEKQFGKEPVQEITPTGGVWHVSFRRLFFLGSESLPLHALSFANLAHKGNLAWVKRAYPKLVFLHAPIISSLSVTPVSGTVGEERTVTFTLRIFGKDESEVTIRDTDIPSFFQGNFTPKIGGRPPSESFFDSARGTERRKRIKVGPNEWLIVHVYRFGLYAPERTWVISGIQIPYMWKGEQRLLDVPPATFFVRAHLGDDYQLNDMPQALPLVSPEFQGFTQKEPVIEARWFDFVAQFIGGRVALQRVLQVVVVMAIVVFAVFLVMAAIRLAPKGRDDGKMTKGDLAVRLERANLKSALGGALAEYQDILSRLFHAWDPELPERNITLQRVKDHLKGSGRLAALASSAGVPIEELFRDIESRHAPNFGERSDDELLNLRIRVRTGVEKLANVLLKNGSG